MTGEEAALRGGSVHLSGIFGRACDGDQHFWLGVAGRAAVPCLGCVAHKPRLAGPGAHKPQTVAPKPGTVRPGVVWLVRELSAVTRMFGDKESVRAESGTT